MSSFTADEATKLIVGTGGVPRFDVAEDHSRFIWAGDPPLTDGLPDHDTPFVGQGYIYPAGTLTESNGVLEDGSPEFLDKVLGQLCYWMRRSGLADLLPLLRTVWVELMPGAW